MKHRNPTRQHALLALLASLSLSGCQWDSVLYDSYIAAFGEKGAGEFAECPGMEYILIRDTTTKDENNDNTEDGNTENNNDGDDTNKESNYIKLYRSTCCITNEDGSCTLRENALEINKYCIAFQFNKCPLTASRCMTETVTITNSLEDTGEPKENEQIYCAEVVCGDNSIECEINYKKDASDDKVHQTFTCINPSENKRCNAKCPDKNTIITINSNETFTQALDREFQSQACGFNKTCDPVDNNTPNTPPEYQCNCIEGTILCDGNCIDPTTDLTYCGAKGNCDNDNRGTTCKSTQRCIKDKNENYVCGCPEGLIECDGDCINPDTDIRYCGAREDCTNNRGQQCGENFECREGNCECISEYQTCDISSTNYNGRREPTCVPINPTSDTQNLWKSLKFDDSGCNCQDGYSNKDGSTVLHPDANGCETAETGTDCGTVGIDAVNCVEKYHGDDSKTTCQEGKCSITGCKEGYILHSLKDLSSNRTDLFSDDILKDFSSHIAENENTQNICLLNNNNCCGKACQPCDTINNQTCRQDNEDSDNDQDIEEYLCLKNNCSSNGYYCFGNCYTSNQLKNMHMNTNCECEDGYIHQSNEYCTPDYKRLCELASTTENPLKYCFGQCLSESELKTANIKNTCGCINGYKESYLTSENDPVNSPGYCQKIMDQKEFCGYEQLNCTQYENAANIVKDSITCKDYACHFECKNNKCNWDNDLANGCETSLPKGFKNCNECESNDAFMLTDGDIKKCINKGPDWGNDGRPEWNQENVQTYCSKCYSNQYCRYSKHENKSKCCNTNTRC